MALHQLRSLDMVCYADTIASMQRLSNRFSANVCLTFIACHSGLLSNLAPPISTDVATNRSGEDYRGDAGLDGGF